MNAGNNPRRSNGSRRTKLRKQVAAEGLPCHICGRPIDYSLEPGDPMSYELDEIVPVSRGGDPLDRGNVAPAHRICNQKRGNKPLSMTGLGAGREPGAHCDVLSLPLPVSQAW